MTTVSLFDIGFYLHSPNFSIFDILPSSLRHILNFVFLFFPPQTTSHFSGISVHSRPLKAVQVLFLVFVIHSSSPVLGCLSHFMASMFPMFCCASFSSLQTTFPSTILHPSGSFVAIFHPLRSLALPDDLLHQFVALSAQVHFLSVLPAYCFAFVVVAHISHPLFLPFRVVPYIALMAYKCVELNVQFNPACFSSLPMGLHRRSECRYRPLHSSLGLQNSAWPIRTCSPWHGTRLRHRPSIRRCPAHSPCHRHRLSRPSSTILAGRLPIVPSRYVFASPLPML